MRKLEEMMAIENKGPDDTTAQESTVLAKWNTNTPTRPSPKRDGTGGNQERVEEKCDLTSAIEF